MNALETALRYATRWPIFPAQWKGERRKRPLVKNGFFAAESETEIEIRVRASVAARGGDADVKQTFEAINKRVDADLER